MQSMAVIKVTSANEKRDLNMRLVFALEVAFIKSEHNAVNVPFPRYRFTGSFFQIFRVFGIALCFYAIVATKHDPLGRVKNLGLGPRLLTLPSKS